MSKSKLKINCTYPLLVLSLGIFLSPSVYACSPSFPLTLLNDKAQTLTTLHQINFHSEVLRIGELNANHQFLTKFRNISPSDNKSENQKISIEPNKISGKDDETLKMMRLADNSQQAEIIGAELSDELRWYTAGAVAFAHKEYIVASRYFQQVLNLPAVERPLRSTWAAYSLARIQSGRMTADSLVKDTNAARKHFELVRQFAMDGFSDPLQLAIASLGEQALLDKNDKDWASAILLYVEQLRQGSNGANHSLRMVASELIRLPESQLQLQLQKSEVQQLITAYIISDLGWNNNNPSQRSLKLIQLLLGNKHLNLANADRLAALSYQAGYYDETRAFLIQAGDSGLAWWLRAKIALLDGDKTSATLAYAKAARTFPEIDDGAMQEGTNYSFESFQSRCRIEGENALLALDRDDYQEALRLLYRGGDIYWEDIALVAERILTTNELKKFVDEQKIPDHEMNWFQDKSAYSYGQPMPLKFRELLGRRLLREGRYREAIAYFNNPELKKMADQYVKAREMGKRGAHKIDRAEGLYNAAVIARLHGMELLGYELSPDYYIWSGGYQSKDPIFNEQWNAAELSRFISSKPQPLQRYHYRYLAADLANQAADLLPARSQAFSAVLCKAHDMLVNRDSQLAQRYNRRYIAEGALDTVTWRNPMSAPCDPPNFALARERLWKYRRLALYEAIQPYKGVLITTIVIVLLVGGGWTIKRRKQIFSK